MNYERRRSDTVNIGGIILGGDNPIRLQSMTNTSTMNTEASAAQCESIARAGADYVRLTAQGEREANNLALIRDMLRSRGCMIPLIADIHFNPKAAFAAARNVDKVRINPGNFIDPGRTFKHLEYTDEEYAAELDRLDKALAPLLELCASRGVALRIGVNHGSLSDRIMSRYGDTPAGMTESAMEFLRVCRRHGFRDVVLSIKASNVVVMVETVRMLVKAMDKEDMHFPLHLGVTEAGDGEDGRVKSAVGIGTLLAEGLGDTIRVSLSEAPEAELPVARAIVDRIDRMASAPVIDYEEENIKHRPSVELPVLKNGIACATVGAGKAPAVAASGSEASYSDTRWAEERRPDIFIGDTDNVIEISADEILSAKPEIDPNLIITITSSHPNFPAHIRAARQSLSARGFTNPIIVKRTFTPDSDVDRVTVDASIDLGSLLLDGVVDGIMIEAPALTPEAASELAFTILQATRRRITATEYIACPGCGRTLFDLPATLAKVKEATAGLKGLKIGVMGCVVNGPGEMADADYGYVGAAAGHVSLYKGKACIAKNIPESEAPQKLVEFIKADRQ